MPSWPALDLTFSPGDLRPVSTQDLALAALDGLAVVAIEEVTPSEWRVFFRQPAERDAAGRALEDATFVTLRVSPVDVVGEDWARRSQAELRSIRVGRFVISPPWDVPQQAAPADVVLIVEPSMGFGTGHHATTRLCLQALQLIDVRGARVLDVGTGSGVLAMAAARLGALQVTAVDIDVDALASAAANLVLNNLSATIDLRQLDYRHERLHPADVALANLTGGMLSTSASRLLTTCRAGGCLVVSGVLRTEEHDVVAAFGDDVTVSWRGSEEEWVGLVLQKR